MITTILYVKEHQLASTNDRELTEQIQLMKWVELSFCKGVRIYKTAPDFSIRYIRFRMKHFIFAFAHPVYRFQHLKNLIMKRLLFFVLIIFLSCPLMSQETKTLLGILPFRSVMLGENAYTKQVSELVTQAFVSTGRFSLFDEERLQQLMVENNLSDQNLSDLNSSAFCEIGRAVGIRYIVSGDLKLVETKPVQDLTGKQAYTAHVIFSVQYVDVNTGEIGNVKLFDSYGAVGGFVNLSYDTEHNAIIKTIQMGKKPIEKFIHDNFPLVIPITGIMEEKNDEAVMVEILGGKELGLEKNMKIEVFSVQIRAINGKNYRKLKRIGALKITEVQGDQFSEAKVLDGGKDILRQFKMDPATLECKTQ